MRNHEKIRSLSRKEVTVTGGFFAPFLRQQATVTLDHIFDMFDFTHSFDVFDEVAAGKRFWNEKHEDSDGDLLIPVEENRKVGDKSGLFKRMKEPWREGLIYETLTGACGYLSELRKDPSAKADANSLEKRILRSVDRIFAAGLTATGCDADGRVIDGYFSVHNLLCRTSVFDEADNRNAVFNHDLYNLGCLTEAAIAVWQALGDERLLFLAVRFTEFTVDYVDGVGGFSGYVAIPPHAISEEALFRLCELFDSDPSLVQKLEKEYGGHPGLSPDDRYFPLHIRVGRYRELYRLWMSERGNAARRFEGKIYGEYSQDDMPAERMTSAAGHAVRANLFYAALAAIGLGDGNDAYLDAAERIFDDILSGQAYVTGGCGATYDREAYAGNGNLPQNGYNETCAAVALGFFADDLFRATGAAKYSALLEKELYNGVLGSVSAEGNAFYYMNPLISEKYRRPFWSGLTPCCPPMIAKFFARMPEYLYAVSGTSLYVNQYITSEASFRMGDADVRLTQDTSLPVSDGASLTFPNGFSGKLFLRVPEWAGDFRVTVGGTAVGVAEKDGYAVVLSPLYPGETVTVSFGLAVRRLTEDVPANRGQVALSYGPLVFCAESDDNPTLGETFGKSEDPAWLDLSVTAKKGVTVLPEKILTVPDGAGIDVRADSRTFSLAGRVGRMPITVPVLTVRTETPITFIPFFARQNRSFSTMRVWFERT